MRSGAVVDEEGRFMRMADESERAQGRPGRILAADASVRNPSRGGAASRASSRCRDGWPLRGSTT